MIKKAILAILVFLVLVSFLWFFFILVSFLWLHCLPAIDCPQAKDTGIALPDIAFLQSDITEGDVRR